jgi:hypothetical protein
MSDSNGWSQVTKLYPAPSQEVMDWLVKIEAVTTPICGGLKVNFPSDWMLVYGKRTGEDFVTNHHGYSATFETKIDESDETALPVWSRILKPSSPKPEVEIVVNRADDPAQPTARHLTSGGGDRPQR